MKATVWDITRMTDVEIEANGGIKMKYTQDNLNNFNDESVLKSHNAPSQIDGFFSPLSIVFLKESIAVDAGANLMLYFDGQNWVCGPMKFELEEMMMMHGEGKINCKQMDAQCIVLGLIDALDYDDMNCVLYSYFQTTVNRLVHDFGSKTVIAILEKMDEYAYDYDESQMFSAAIKLAEVNDNKEIGESTVIHARRYIDYFIEQMQKSEGDNV